MMQGKLAELFIDITLRGGAKAQIKDIKDRIEATDKALAKNAVFYQAVTGEKIRQMGRLAENQEKLARVDQRTYGKLPYAGYTDKQAKAEIATEIAGKQKMIALSQAELKALSGKRGLELAQKTVQSERIKKQVEEVKNQQRLIAEHGKLGATIRQTAGLLAKAASLRTLAALGPVAAVVGTAIATAPAASPIHADTLSKSFDLLSAQIGTILLPIVDDLSIGMQKLAGFIDFLNGKKKADGKKEAGFLDWIGFQIFGPFTPFIKNKGEEPTRPATGPAHWEAFDQTWRRIQQEIAGRGPLEQQIFDIQMQNLPAQTLALQQIAVNTKPANQPPPPPALPP
jgi:hypothetical protein